MELIAFLLQLKIMELIKLELATLGNNSIDHYLSIDKNKYIFITIIIIIIL